MKMRKLMLWGMLTVGLAAAGVLGKPFLYAQGMGSTNSVRALALSPDGSVLAGTFGSGLYRSRDQGVHWQKLSEGLADSFILTILPVTGDEIYVGTVRKGVFRSRDRGASWKEVNTGLGRTEVKALLFDRGRLYAGTGDGVFVSPNHGEKWEAYNTGMERVLVRALVVDRKGNLLAGTEGRGIYRRGPNDASWTQVTRGFEGNQGILENFIRTLTTGPNSILFAGTFDGGVYMSKDGGAQWAWWSPGMKNQSIRAVLVGPKETLYVGTGKGVYARPSGAGEWAFISEELEDDSIQSMVVDSSGLIYAGTSQGLYKGTVRGKWEMITPGFSQLSGGNREGERENSERGEVF